MLDGELDERVRDVLRDAYRLLLEDKMGEYGDHEYDAADAAQESMLVGLCKTLGVDYP